MRLAFRTAAVVGCGALLVLGADLAWTVAREREVLEQEKHEDHLRLLAVVARQVGPLIEAGELDRAHQALHAMRDDALSLALVAPGAAADAETHLVTRWPLSAELELVATEANARERGFLRGSMTQRLGTVSAMVLVMMLLAWWFSARIIARRIDALVQHLRDVGGGRAPLPLATSGSDELATLAREANAMTSELHRTRRALEAEHAERIRTLEQLRHADRLATVGRLATGLAHELGAPLSVIAIKADRLREDERTTPAMRAQALVIRDRVEFIRTLVRRVLRFGRPVPPVRRSVDLVELTKEAIAMLAPLGAKAGVVVKLETAAAAVPLAVDPHQLEQVLTNLLANAFLASAPRQVVEVSVGSDGADAVIRVRDHGVGMTRETREHLFEPFFTTRPVGEGTGLGLSVCWGIVRDHGGRIDVESTPGAGSTFTVVLPHSAEENHHDAPTHAPAPTLAPTG